MNTKEYYAENKEKLQANKKAVKESEIQHLKNKLGNKCVRCGTVEGLEFDHIDPKTKKYKISNHYYRYDIMEELAKCQLLCGPCHDKKTVENGENNR